MTNTPWILTEVHRNPDCLEWIISTERSAGAIEGCNANPRIATFDEMGGSGAGRCEGRHNALAAVTASLLLTELRALAHLAKPLHFRQRPSIRHGIPQCKIRAPRGPRKRMRLRPSPTNGASEGRATLIKGLRKNNFGNSGLAFWPLASLLAPYRPTGGVGSSLAPRQRPKFPRHKWPTYFHAVPKNAQKATKATKAGSLDAPLASVHEDTLDFLCGDGKDGRARLRSR